MNFSELCGFTERQWEATETADQHKYTLFGGSRGPGKSYWLRWYLVRRLLMWAGQGHTGVRVMLACEDYPQLRERQITKIEVEFPAWLGYYHKTASEFRLLPKWGGGVIALRNLDDASKYQSAEYAIIAIDEIAKNSFRTFDILRGSLRWKGISDTSIIGASNPSPNWVRDLWIEKKFPSELATERDQFAFVKALPDDNPHLDPSYWKMLNTLAKPLREAWRNGDWYAAVEGLVLSDFSQDNVTDMEPDMDRPIELAIDDGYMDPRAILFIQKLPGGDILVFDEIYKTKQLEEQSIAQIQDRIVGTWYDLGDPPDDLEFPDWFHADRGQGAEWLGRRAAWMKEVQCPLPEIASVSHEAPALRRRLREADIPARNWLSTKAGQGSTKMAAINRLRSLVLDGQGHRALKVHERCYNFLDEVRMGWKMKEGRNGPEELPADGNDHACDAISGWVWLRARYAA